MIKVMETLKASSGEEGGSVPQMFQTHPDPDLRIEQIKEYLKKHPPSPDLKDGRNLKVPFQ